MSQIKGEINSNPVLERCAIEFLRNPSESRQYLLEDGRLEAGISKYQKIGADVLNTFLNQNLHDEKITPELCEQIKEFTRLNAFTKAHPEHMLSALSLLPGGDSWLLS